jgi:hypothetical protein
MAALNTKREQTTSAEDAVFVARDGRRARRLRNAAVALGVLAILWVVGLAVGMLGFGSLPGVALVKGVASHAPPAEASALPAAKREVSRLLAADDPAARHRARASTGHQAASVGARHRSSTRKRSGRPAATPSARNAAEAPVTASPRTRGWSRRGYSAPRGQLRKVAPPPPPVTSRGRRVGPQKPPQPPPPPVSPGQAKKAELPPPPPPPPPKKA